MAADFDGNYLIDLAILEERMDTGEGQVRFLLQQTPGVFQTTSPLPTGGSDPRALAVSDMNGDGRVDLVVIHGRTQELSILTNFPPL